MKEKNKKLRSILRTKKILVVPATVLATITAFFLGVLLKDSLAAPVGPGSWPSNSDWVKLTQNSTVVTDREARSGCSDNTTGGANPSQMDDIGSQARCKTDKDHPKKYNPGLIDTQFNNGQQPNSTANNTYSGAIFATSNNMFFRVRLAGDPEEHCRDGRGHDDDDCDKTLQHNYWYFNLDVDANGTPDFYVKVYGSNGGDGSDDFIQVIHEETGNDEINDYKCSKNPCDSFGTKLDNVLKDGWCRVSKTPDNNTVGDAEEYFLDCQVPMSMFKDSDNEQLISACDDITVDNYTTSENGNDPYKKDNMMSGNADTVNFCAPTPTADLSITKTDNATTSTPGTQITYTIVATNNGPDAVTGASVTDTFPSMLSGETWTCAASAGSSCTASGSGDINDTSVNLLNGGTATYTVTATINAGATSSLVNTATITAPQSVDDENTSNNTATDTNSLTPSTDLSITKTGSETVMAGNNLTYTITVTNNGPSDSTGATVTDTLPSGVTFVSATATDGSCDEESGTVTCTLGSIADGGYENIMIIVNIPSSAEDGSQLENTASVTGNETDPDLTNNGGDASTVVTMVSSGADLSVTKEGSPNPVRAGDPLTYSVTVTNNGPSESLNVVLTDMLPSNINFVSATADAGSCSEESGIVTCNLGDMASEASVNVSIVINPLTDGQTPGYVFVNNTVSVTADTLDPDNENNTASSETTIAPNTDLAIVKTDSPDPVQPGFALTYNLAVTNFGPTAAGEVTVTDTLPTGMNFVSATPDQGTCLESDGTIICDLGTINDEDTVNIEVVIVVPSDTPSDTILTNTATVSTGDTCVPNGDGLVATIQYSITDDGCNPADPNPENNTSTVETLVSSGGGGNPPPPPPPGGGGGEAPPPVTAPAPVEVLKAAAEERKYCLAFDASRPLTFLDTDQAKLLTPYPVPEANLTDVEKALDVIKDTYLANIMMETEATQVSDIFAFMGKQWVISGYPNRDAKGVPVTQGSTAFIGPFTNTTRLELAKVLLLSHCYPILNSTELTTRNNSDEPIHVWDDLPNTDLGDPVSNYARDVAYSAQYWWVWDGFWNEDQQRFDRVGINDLVTVAQTIKMNDRLGQLVKGDTNFIEDASEGLWWKTYYAHANLELAGIVTPELLASWRADEIIKRGEGIYNVLKVMIARDLYSPTDLEAIKAYLASSAPAATAGEVTP